MCLCARTRMNKCSYMYFDPAAPSFLSALQPWPSFEDFFGRETRKTKVQTQHNKTFPPQFYSRRRQAVKISKTGSMIISTVVSQLSFEAWMLNLWVTMVTQFMGNTGPHWSVFLEGAGRRNQRPVGGLGSSGRGPEAHQGKRFAGSGDSDSYLRPALLALDQEPFLPTFLAQPRGRLAHAPRHARNRDQRAETWTEVRTGCRLSLFKTCLG